MKLVKVDEYQNQPNEYRWGAHYECSNGELASAFASSRDEAMRLAVVVGGEIEDEATK